MTSKIYLPKWVEILVGIYLGLNASQIQLDTKITYAHVSNVIKDFEMKGYVKRVADGRKNKLVLSKKGEELAEIAVALQKLLK